LGTAATIFAAIFAYRSVKQFQSFCESESWRSGSNMQADSCMQLRMLWNLPHSTLLSVLPPLRLYNRRIPKIIIRWSPTSIRRRISFRDTRVTVFGLS
jgi:hypothetical protein